MQQATAVRTRATYALSEAVLELMRVADMQHALNVRLGNGDRTLLLVGELQHLNTIDLQLGAINGKPPAACRTFDKPVSNGFAATHGNQFARCTVTPGRIDDHLETVMRVIEKSGGQRLAKHLAVLVFNPLRRLPVGQLCRLEKKNTGKAR